MAKNNFMPLKNDEKYEIMHIRFRTIGDMSCTGAIISDATTLEDIIQEVASSRVTERGGRADDKRSDAAMEDRKKEGYF
jgi:sulfate adenylyltransferase subunit 2